ncbi:MAG: ABC transporter ATP-binding protein [Bacteroidia bacterium]|nr:ABC transporter ATP-binding protein [Bacteroidia bacterium]
MTVSLNNLGKKFNREWIFRNLDFEILPCDKLVILGGNGSGKSTLLQVISGFVSPNEGSLIYKSGNQSIEPENIKNYISFASPYLQLIEDFTLEEMIEHAAKFKPFSNNLPVKEIIGLIELSQAKGKYIKQFSSGMKQRLKLGLAILADTPVLLLDEPVSNLDKKAIEWYGQLIKNYTANRTVIVCSNAITEEYSFCNRQLDVAAFKPSPKS